MHITSGLMELNYTASKFVDNGRCTRLVESPSRSITTTNYPPAMLSNPSNFGAAFMESEARKECASGLGRILANKFDADTTAIRIFAEKEEFTSSS